MARSKRKRKNSQPQTFDPEDFDIHELGHFKRSKIWPASRKEKMVNVKKDWKSIEKNSRQMKKEAGQKSIFVTIFSNLLLPGLGNVYIQKNPISIAIFFTALVAVLLTFSPLFPIVQLLQSVDAVPAPVYSSAVITYFSVDTIHNANVTLVGPSFSFLLFPFILSWLHLAYLFFKHQYDWNWRF